MPRQCEWQLVARDAVAVIRDADEARSARFDVDGNAARAGVERIFDELLDDGRGPLDDPPAAI
jgi:hypothetical protein